ncbi:hypothetical protein CW306_03225 [Bacillus sp. BA3]|uniref:hypothetical protein n=1 Tax=Bacillus sp. BA3 TaxID=2057910 RepID=UPI000C34E115|nr:hypothetical protein [Bacillus sp. BA3]PKF90531.1 hypothetical protein CW306_03225 [Bacillus sp. BA3]
MFNVKNSPLEKVLSGILIIITACVFVAIPSGIAFSIGFIFKVDINYVIPAGIGLFFYVFSLLITITQQIRFKKFADETGKDFNDFF